MVEKIYDVSFDIASSGRPWMVFPKVFTDNRGSFSEVLVGDGLDSIKQVNRSTSCQWTVRGCHAQRAPHCQSKLVEALTLPIYDIITDARPDSKTFGLTEAYLLDPEKQNKLFVPHGFLHAFAVPPSGKDGIAMFMYYCDDIYSKENEVAVNPMSILPDAVRLMSSRKDSGNCIAEFASMFNAPERLVLSRKDLESQSFQKFMEDTMDEYKSSKKLWYK